MENVVIATSHAQPISIITFPVCSGLMCREGKNGQEKNYEKMYLERKREGSNKEGGSQGMRG